eukprot:g54875.t1
MLSSSSSPVIVFFRVIRQLAFQVEGITQDAMAKLELRHTMCFLVAPQLLTRFRSDKSIGQRHQQEVYYLRFGLQSHHCTPLPQHIKEDQQDATHLPDNMPWESLTTEQKLDENDYQFKLNLWAFLPKLQRKIASPQGFPIPPEHWPDNWRVGAPRTYTMPREEPWYPNTLLKDNTLNLLWLERWMKEMIMRETDDDERQSLAPPPPNSGYDDRPMDGKGQFCQCKFCARHHTSPIHAPLVGTTFASSSKVQYMLLGGEQPTFDSIVASLWHRERGPTGSSVIALPPRLGAIQLETMQAPLQTDARVDYRPSAASTSTRRLMELAYMQQLTSDVKLYSTQIARTSYEAVWHYGLATEDGKDDKPLDVNTRYDPSSTVREKEWRATRRQLSTSSKHRRVVEGVLRQQRSQNEWRKEGSLQLIGCLAFVRLVDARKGLPMAIPATLTGLQRESLIPTFVGTTPTSTCKNWTKFNGMSAQFWKQLLMRVATRDKNRAQYSFVHPSPSLPIMSPSLPVVNPSTTSTRPTGPRAPNDREARAAPRNVATTIKPLAPRDIRGDPNDPRNIVSGPRMANQKEKRVHPDIVMARKAEVQGLYDAGCLRWASRDEAKKNGVTPIHTGFVDAVKHNESTGERKYKSRLIIFGSKMSPYEHFSPYETSTPVAHHFALLILCAIMVALNALIKQIDFSQAYIHANMEDLVYSVPPEGFRKDDDPWALWLVLKQAGSRCHDHVASGRAFPPSCAKDVN